MTKIILFILVVLVSLGGGYFYFSKNSTQTNVQLQPTTSPTTEGTKPSAAPLVPIAGKTITIRNCKGEPYILEVSEGDEISFVNADGEEHAIFIAGANKDLKLPAKGLIKYTARRASGAPTNFAFTDNYICDSTNFTGGAIYIPAQ